MYKLKTFSCTHTEFRSGDPPSFSQGSGQRSLDGLVWVRPDLNTYSATWKQAHGQRTASIHLPNKQPLKALYSTASHSPVDPHIHTLTAESDCS